MSVHACIVFLFSQNCTLICGCCLFHCEWIKTIETWINLLCHQPCTHVLEWRTSLGSLKVCSSSMSSVWLSTKIARVQGDRSLRRNTNKRPSQLMRERNFARERLVLLPPLPCILMWRVSPPAVAWHQSRAVSMQRHHWGLHQEPNEDDLQLAAVARHQSRAVSMSRHHWQQHWANEDNLRVVGLYNMLLVMLAVAAKQLVAPSIVLLLLLQAISLQCRWVASNHCL